MIYYIVIFFLFLFSFKSQIKTNLLEQRILTIITAIIIVLFGAFRVDVGADWPAYKRLFVYLKVEEFSDLFLYREEPLYILVNYLLKSIYDNFSFFIFVLFSVTFLLKFKIFNRFSPDVYLSTIIYFYTVFVIYDVNGLRQGIALTLTLLSVIYIYKNKFLPFLLLVITASFFHKSAIIFIPFYFISKFNFSVKRYYYIILITLILATPVREIFKMSSLYNSLMATEAFEHYSAYQNAENYQVDISVFSFAVFQRVFIIIVFLFYFNKVELFDKKLVRILRNGYVLGFVIFMLFSFSAEMAARLSFYYKSFEILMIPILVSSFDAVDKRIIYLVIFTMFAVIGLSRLLALPEGMLIPYQNLIYNWL